MPRPALALLLLGGALAARPAAAVDCADLPNPVWMQIGDTQENLIKYLGQKLRVSTVNPITLIYVTNGSCTNIDAMYSKTAIKTNAKYIPSPQQDSTWTPDKATPTCTISNTDGHGLDIANSALFVSACSPPARPAFVSETQGPIQAYVMIVPRGTGQHAITAEEAYFVFGFGQQGQATPWTDESQLYIRPTTKSTLLAWAKNIRVDKDKWKGVPKDTSTLVLNGVAQSPNPTQAIGILGAEVYDGARGSVQSLAFQSYGQHHAFWPDSTDTAFDKINLRDGHYTVWSPTVWMLYVDEISGAPINNKAKYVVDLIAGKNPSPTFDANAMDVVIGRGIVPDCAMKVSRTEEGGDLFPYVPAAPCGCYYESKTPSGTTCAACSEDFTCGAGKCRYGYCEAK
jgi:hypothetical protein